MAKIEDSNKQITLGAIISYVNILFNIVSGLIYTPWMVQQIGQADYGLYTLSTSLIAMFTVDFGIGASVSRFISKYRAEGNQDKIDDFLGITYKLYLIITSIIFVVLLLSFFSIERTYVHLTEIEIQKFKVIYCISGLFTIISFPFMPINGLIISYEKFIFQKGLDLITRLANIVIMIFLLANGFGLYSLVVINALLGLLGIISKLIYMRKNTKIIVNFKARDKGILKEIWSFSIWTSITGIAQRFIINITPSILGIFAGSKEIAIFSIAMTIEGYVYMMSTALSGMFLSRVTNIVYGNNKNHTRKIEDLMIRVGRIQLLIIGVIIAIFASIGNEFIILWMGNDFQKSYLVALFIIVNSIIIVTQEVANTMIIATNKIKYEALSVGIVAIISFTLSFITSKYWGALGAGISICIANFIGRVIIRNIVYKRVLGLNIKRFFKECHLSMSMPIIVTFLLGVISLKVIPGTNLIIFALKTLALCVTYIILIYFFALNKYEKDIFLKIIYRLQSIKGFFKLSKFSYTK